MTLQIDLGKVNSLNFMIFAVLVQDEVGNLDAVFVRCCHMGLSGLAGIQAKGSLAFLVRYTGSVQVKKMFSMQTH